MANRYWVGGSGTWGTGTTTNWSATSGGAGGASYPTTTDDVFFDQATTYTVTCNGLGGTSSINCRSITVSAGTVTFSSTSTPTLNVYGSFNIKTGTVWTVNNLKFASTTTGNTITTNGVSLGSAVVFDGVGGDWTLAGALTCTSITWTNGTFSTANYAVTISSTLGFRTTTGTKTLNWGSSTLTSTAVGSPTATFVNFGGTSGVETGLTLNAGTSTLNGPTNGTTDFYGGGKTFYNVIFRCAIFYSGDYSSPVYGANTFNNLTFPGASTNAITQVSIWANQTINGTLTIGSSQSAANGGAPLLFKSAVTSSGTSYTITAAAVSITCVTFQNITAAGAAIPWTGTNVGNAGGNTNITFTAAKTVYWSLAAGGTYYDGTSGSIAFATTSGGVPARTNYPLVQDTLIIDNAGLTTGNSIEFSAYMLLCNVNCTRTNAWNFNRSSSGGIINAYGSITIPAVTSSVYVPNFNFFHSNGIKTLTLNGALSTSTMYVGASSGSGIRLGGAWSNPLGSFSSGTIELGGYTWTLSTLNLNASSYPRTITAGGGNFTLTGNNANVFQYAGAYTTLTDTLTVNLTYSGATGTRNIVGPSYASLSASATLNQTNNLTINVTGGTDTVSWQPTAFQSQALGFVNFTGFAGTLAASGYGTVSVTGVTYSSSMTINYQATHSVITYSTGTITTNGKAQVNSHVIGNTPVTNLSANTSLGDAFTSSAGLQLQYGTLTTNNYAVSVSQLNYSGTLATTLNLGSSTITLSGTGFSAYSGSTVNAGTSTISLNSSSSKTFAGGGKTYYNVVQSGIGTLIITGSNTFNSLTNTVQPSTVQFEAASTSTFGTFGLSGTAGNLTSITSTTAGTRYTLTKPSGTVSPTYLSIKDSNATGGAVWDARGTGNVNAGNNLGWLFSDSGMFFMFI